MLFGIKTTVHFVAFLTLGDPASLAPAGLGGGGLKGLTRHGKARYRPRKRRLRRRRIRVEPPGTATYNGSRAGTALSVSNSLSAFDTGCPSAFPAAG